MKRREFLTMAALTPLQSATTETRQSTGIKIGEVTTNAARVWVRRTRASSRLAGGVPARKANPVPAPLNVDVTTLEGACPGAGGYVRLTLATSTGQRVWASSWVDVSSATDFSHQFVLSGLHHTSLYTVTVETAATMGKPADGVMTAHFRTAPPLDSVADIDVAMLSCQKYSQRDNPRGFEIYDSIRRALPHFLLSVGDNVYYDSDDPIVNQTSIARHHWHRMYSQESIVECLRTVPAYFLKDDHDCYSNDTYPGHANPRMAPFTFAEGLKIFPEQTPMGSRTFRSYRWGRGLEVFLLEGRDYRTANNAPDGPSKSIWGPEQKRWLMESVEKSGARWKLIVSPTPIVGPDRPNKKDNHANNVYAHEGAEVRRWLGENRRHDTVVLCGDRHWQYHSVDPKTKIEEFGCGAASDSHAGGTPGETKDIHQFHRVKGGYLTVAVRNEGARSKMILEHRDVAGGAVNRREFSS